MSHNIKPLPHGPPILGRQANEDLLFAHIRDGQRLLTLLGPPGIGKSALALRLAERLTETRQVCWVALTTETSVDGLCGAVATAIGCSLVDVDGVEDAIAKVAQSLAADTALVLVLDDFDHLVEHAVSVVSQWLSRAASLTVLVTSREALGLHMEQRFVLKPLPCDDATPSTAARLFVQRVRLQRPLYSPNVDELAAVENIVQWLEGFPLAIELAAARLAFMSADELQKRLTADETLLAGGPRDTPTRHRGMQSAFEESWTSLSAVEQRTLAACCVFGVGFSLSALEAVVGEPDGALVSVVTCLVGKSLLEVRESKPEGAPYLTIYRLVRTLVLRKVAATDCATYLLRHAQYFVERATLLGETPQQRLTWLEEKSLLAVAERVLEDTCPKALAVLCLRATCLSTKSLLSNGGARRLVMLCDATMRFKDDLESVSVGEVLLARAQAYQQLGMSEEARVDLERVLSLLDAPSLVARASMRLGLVYHVWGSVAPAVQHLSYAISIARKAEDHGCEAEALLHLTRTHYSAGQPVAASKTLTEAFDLHQRFDDKSLYARSLALRGFIALDAEQHVEAEADFTAALALARQQNARSLEGLALIYLGNTWRHRGQLQRAAQMYKQATVLLEVAGERQFEGVAWMDLGIVLALAQCPHQAVEALQRGLEIARQVRNRQGLHLCTGYLAVAYVLQGRQAEAEATVTALEDENVFCGLTQRAVAILQSIVRGGKIPDASAITEEHCRLATQLGQLVCWRGQPPSSMMLVALDRRAVRLPHGGWLDFDRRLPLFALLRRLVEEHLWQPGTVVPPDILSNHIWQEPNVSLEQKLNRLRVAVAALRKVGLREFVVTTTHGYALAANLRVLVIDPQASNANV